MKHSLQHHQRQYSSSSWEYRPLAKLWGRHSHALNCSNNGASSAPPTAAAPNGRPQQPLTLHHDDHHQRHHHHHHHHHHHQRQQQAQHPPASPNHRNILPPSPPSRSSSSDDQQRDGKQLKPSASSTTSPAVDQAAAAAGGGGAVMPTVIALIVNDSAADQSQQQQRIVAILGVLVAAFLSALGYPHRHKQRLITRIASSSTIASTAASTIAAADHHSADQPDALLQRPAAAAAATDHESPPACTSYGSSPAAAANHSRINGKSISNNGSIAAVQSAGMIPAVSIDSLRRGRLIENGCVYRQTFVIRSYEVGFDRTASIETLANLFMETALNHVGMADFVGDGMGTTHAMMRSRLIWVVTKMHIEAVDYPVWGDVVEIDSWVSGSGKNGMRRDFLVRDYLTGQIRARATSHWAMMNQDTRRLSKMPDDVRAEISPYFIERSVMINSAEDRNVPESELYSCQRIAKLDDSAPFIRSGLAPRLHDMDMNQHVNHVKYISWVLESVPQSFLVAHELMGMTLEYRRECTHSDVLSSLTAPDNPNDLTDHHLNHAIASAGSSSDDEDRRQAAAAAAADHHHHRQGNSSNRIVNAAASNVTIVNHSNHRDRDHDHHSRSASSINHLHVNGNKGSMKSAAVAAPQNAANNKTSMIHFTHLLRLEDKTTEILRGRTSWRLKKQHR